MDVIPFISKDQSFPDFPKDFDGRPEYIYAAGPRLHDYLQEMNREVLSKYDVMTVGEAFGVTLEQTPLFVDERRNELNMIFHFDLVRLDCGGWRWKPWTLPEFKAICARFNEGLDAHSWPTVYLTNHDNPRSVSHFGDDSPEYRIPSAKLLATFQLTSKGTPFIYQGDELGMTNYPFVSIEEFDDVWRPGVASSSALTAFKMARFVKWPLVTRLLGEPLLPGLEERWRLDLYPALDAPASSTASRSGRLSLSRHYGRSVGKDNRTRRHSGIRCAQARERTQAPYFGGHPRAADRMQSGAS